MRAYRAFAVAGLALLVLAACGRQDAGEETRHRFMAMGTLVDVTVYGVPEGEARDAARAVETLFNELHREWDPWGEGELGRANRALAAGEPAELGTDLGELLAEAMRLAHETGGLFDPGIGSLVRLWGFDRAEAVPDAPPAAADIEALLAGAGPVQFDLGGFLKGVAVDRGIEVLRAHGIEHAIVNAGGDLRAMGRRGQRAWRIGIRAARDPAEIVAALEIRDDETVFTSGDYERFFEHDGRRYHHVLDPRSGYPTEGIASVTVMHGEAGRADAAATALMVAGPEDWPEMAVALGVERVLVVLADGRIELSEHMAERVAFTAEDYARQARVRPLP